MTGYISNLVKDKGYAFVKSNESDKDYFLHRSEFSGHWDDLVTDFMNGIRISVEFEEGVKNSKGPRAINAKRSDWPNQST